MWCLHMTCFIKAIQCVDGLTHVLRADIVCKRLPNTQSMQDVLWYYQTQFYQSVSLYQSAFAYELDGDAVKASKCYEKGLAARIAISVEASICSF